MPWTLRNDLADLVRQGALTPDQAAGLADKVNAAVGSISTARLTAAVNQLEAFVNQVNAFVNNGKLTAEQGEALIGKVNSTRTRLGL